MLHLVEVQAWPVGEVRHGKELVLVTTNGYHLEWSSSLTRLDAPPGHGLAGGGGGRGGGGGEQAGGGGVGPCVLSRRGVLEVEGGGSGLERFLDFVIAGTGAVVSYI